MSAVIVMIAVLRDVSTVCIYIRKIKNKTGPLDKRCPQKEIQKERWQRAPIRPEYAIRAPPTTQMPSQTRASIGREASY